MAVYCIMVEPGFVLDHAALPGKATHLFFWLIRAQSFFWLDRVVKKNS